MKFLFTAIVALGFLVPGFAQANDDQSLLDHSCRAKSIDRFYCPTAGGWWYGPYYDGGCSVKCEAGQTATCTEATCESYQTGQAIPSSCSCE